MSLTNDAAPRNGADDFRRNITRIVARIGEGPEAPVREFRGRSAWMLSELVKAGPRGVTTLETPAPRISHYLHQLRRDGVSIETRREPHTGTYPGNHGRFVLAVPVSIIEVECGR